MFAEELNSISKLKCNVYCSCISKKLIEVNKTTFYLSRHTKKVIHKTPLLNAASMPPQINSLSPSLPPIQPIPPLSPI